MDGKEKPSEPMQQQSRQFLKINKRKTTRSHFPNLAAAGKLDSEASFSDLLHLKNRISGLWRKSFAFVPKNIE